MIIIIIFIYFIYFIDIIHKRHKNVYMNIYKDNIVTVII